MLMRAEGITKAYHQGAAHVRALDGASVELDAGEMVGLIGPSGSGKSTFGRIVAGIEAADAGTLELQGAACSADERPSRRPRAFKEALRDVQMVFQNPEASFSPRMKVGPGVEEGVAYRGIPKPERARLVREAFEQVGLPWSYAGKYAWELSGGECQRAALARAIVGGPKLLVCDEPTSALDVTIQAQIVRLLDALCRENGMACLFISHDLALVRGLCQRAYVLDAGAVVESGPVAGILDSPQSDAARLLASSIVTF